MVSEANKKGEGMSTATLTLSDITKKTIQFYDGRAKEYFEESKNYDLRKAYHDFISLLPEAKYHSILDLGCGGGRDLKYFADHGFQVVGLDGSKKMCDLARKWSGCKAFQQDFLSLELPPSRFHGIFAASSLFHIPKAELTRILRQVHYSLKEGGVLYLSNPVGESEEWDGESYGNYMNWNAYKGYLKEAGFQPIKHYEMTVGEPWQETTWLNILSTKK